MAGKTNYCENCGAHLPAGAKFCTSCGAPVPDYAQTSGESGKKGGSKGAKSSIKWIILAAAVVAAALVLVVFVASPGSIKLDQYMTFETEGTDGYGQVTCRFDADSFYLDYGDRIEAADSSLEQVYVGLSGAEMLYYECIDWDVNYPDAENGFLSNGDTVTVEWKCRDSGAKKYFNAKLKYSDLTYEVAGLAEVEEINVFSYIDVIFEGTDPFGEAHIESYGEETGILAWDFELSESSGLKNGDIVTARFNEDAISDLILYYGITPMEMEKEYVVTGLSTYVTQVSDIPADTMNVMRDTAEEIIRQEENVFINGITISSIDYEGCYVASEDPETAAGAYSNEAYLAYALTIDERPTAYDNIRDTFIYYTYVGFYDLLLSPDGTASFDEDGYDTCVHTFTRKYGTNDWESESFDGYESTAQMLNDLDAVSELHDTDIIASDSLGSSEPTNTEGGTADEADIDYLCSYSSERLITDADMAALRAVDYGSMPGDRSLEQMLINEIYARHGYQFTDAEVQQYFEQKDWYKAIGTYSNDMNYIVSQMSDIERQNVTYLNSFL